MDDWKLPWTGGCRCGRLRFEITAPPLLTMACHCTGCQRMSASAFSLSMAIPEGGFRVTAGEPVVGGAHGAEIHHRHCDWCKSWVFTELEPSMGFVNVRPTMLDDCGWFKPYIETYASEALPWAKTGAAHSFDRFPAMGAYGPLVAEFAEKSARPGR
ncbi:aldehyde-activating protein [Burkholderia sp. MSMB1552]|uniref:GFA family protein n=1 Tax=Burkholderia TaxID=32008 RepID=UPI0005D8438D|nr:MULTISPECIES: GFA family protein [Burkholderia]AJY41818.1 glutathione-dependent formaldehyde-activating enzyme family protein [Burkholderia sp. 2002721687]ALX41859.1 aldehyde-activating protein [Burkholderia humptydooensis]KVN05609.1 aldehyde-activating protein [Burkholderia sp. MSMB1552]KWZ56622.1 aldehyde-activating protein [Burkholderia sp. MSMB1588]